MTNNKKTRNIAAGLIALGLLLMYQNCAPPGRVASLVSLHGTASTTVSSTITTTTITTTTTTSTSTNTSSTQTTTTRTTTTQTTTSVTTTTGMANITPCIPLRTPSINEGFASLPGYSLGQPTTTTVEDINQRLFQNQGTGAVKIWPIFQTLANGELDSIFNDPRLKVVVFRPFNNQTQVPSRPAQTSAACSNRSPYHRADVDTDYGLVAQLLYQRFGSRNKIIILSGWEADNQLNYLSPSSACDPKSWPTNQAEINTFKAMLQTRQNAIAAVRQQNASANLRVFHAVEINKAPEAPGPPGNPSATVLERIIPQMNPRPDFISYSAWGSKPINLANRLSTIASASGLPRDRIFIGEWGCRMSNPNRAACFSNHAREAFQWGARLWFVWTYAGPGGDSYDLINGQTGEETSHGFSEITKIKRDWWATRACN